MTLYMPLFPLELVVFPGEQLNLHIFEDRYKQLVTECFNANKTFGIPAFMDGQVAEFGTEVEIVSIENIYPDGKMDIRTKGLRLFRIINFMQKAEDAAYPAGVVSYEHEYAAVPTESKGDEDTVKNLKELLATLSGLLNIHKKLLPSNENYISFKIAHYLGMPISEEYRLLLTSTETQRQQIIIRFLETAIPDIEKREVIREKISLNGHFKELKPPHF